MVTFKAKVEVIYKDVTYQPEQTFEVSPEDAEANGWNVENPTVEIVPAPTA